MSSTTKRSDALRRALADVRAARMLRAAARESTRSASLHTAAATDATRRGDAGAAKLYGGRAKTDTERARKLLDEAIRRIDAARAQRASARRK